MSLLRIIYLVLVVVGAVVPLMHYIPWAGDDGFTFDGFVSAWTVNGATTGSMWDMAIAAGALTLWMMAEVYVRKDWRLLPTRLIALLGLGLPCGLPSYLLLRSRALT
mgnify:CR=1 FL=1